MNRSWIFLLCTSISLAAPVDELIKVDLPVYNEPEPLSNVVIQQLLLENPGGEVEPGSSLVEKINQKIQSGDDILSKKVELGGLFAASPTKLESAILETEAFPSKALSIKDNIHNKVAGIFQPKPIVDTLREEEKYGNEGDKFYAAGRAIVGGASSVSTLVNNVLEVPGNILKKISRAATAKLNNLGGKLIGL